MAIRFLNAALDIMAQGFGLSLSVRWPPLVVCNNDPNRVSMSVCSYFWTINTRGEAEWNTSVTSAGRFARRTTVSSKSNTALRRRLQEPGSRPEVIDVSSSQNL
jgi:hypothetical protein